MKRLARRTASRRRSSSENGSATVDSVLAIVRSLWQAVEGTPGSDQPKLKKDITQTINRLRGRLKKKLGQPVIPAPTERLLFDGTGEERPATPESAPALPPVPPRFAEPVLRVYAKDFAAHALHHLPQAAKYRSVEEFRKHLADKLRFNSEATRRRAANYIISRFFPGDLFNSDLPAFAAATAGKRALGEALFYLTCRTERIVSLVAEEVVYASLAQGGVGRTRIREFVQGYFPESKSVEHIGQSIVRTYDFFGIGTVTRTRLNVSLREGSLSSFTYILHLEFPEPGMYSFERLFDGPMHKWLLWDRRWMVRQLYLLREAGLVPKVSEIDRLRQFTTKYTLAEEVQQPVKKDLFQNADPDLFGSHVQSRWYLKETADQVDRAEQTREDAAAARLEKFVREQLRQYPEHEGVHYSDLFEQFLPVTEKPRRLLADWLPEYFIKTPSGTWRPPDDGERRQLAKLRAAGTLRRIKRFAYALIEGVPVRGKDRPGSDRDLLDWLRQCRRAGLYDQGRALFEKGGLNLDNLSPEEQIEADDN
jgi:hypothetical protein